MMWCLHIQLVPTVAYDVVPSHAVGSHCYLRCGAFICSWFPLLHMMWCLHMQLVPTVAYDVVPSNAVGSHCCIQCGAFICSDHSLHARNSRVCGWWYIHSQCYNLYLMEEEEHTCLPPTPFLVVWLCFARQTRTFTMGSYFAHFFVNLQIV